jgi:hypothetical protein
VDRFGGGGGDSGVARNGLSSRCISRGEQRFFGVGSS